MYSTRMTRAAILDDLELPPMRSLETDRHDSRLPIAIYTREVDELSHGKQDPRR